MEQYSNTSHFHNQNIEFYQKNTLDLFSWYEKQYSFKTVVFTNSSCYMSYASSLHMETSSEYQTNKYGLPILKSMLITVRNRYSYDYIGYLNNDILVHPGIFDVLDTVSKAVRNGELSPSFILASRVANSNNRLPMRTLCQFNHTCLKAFKTYQNTAEMRTPTSVV